MVDLFLQNQYNIILDPQTWYNNIILFHFYEYIHQTLMHGLNMKHPQKHITINKMIASNPINIKKFLKLKVVPLQCMILIAIMHDIIKLTTNIFYEHFIQFQVL